MRRALKIDEAALWTEHPSVAFDLNNLAQLLQETNRLEEAKPLMRGAGPFGFAQDRLSRERVESRAVEQLKEEAEEM